MSEYEKEFVRRSFLKWWKNLEEELRYLVKEEGVASDSTVQELLSLCEKKIIMWSK